MSILTRICLDEDHDSEQINLQEQIQLQDFFSRILLPETLSKGHQRCFAKGSTSSFRIFSICSTERSFLKCSSRCSLLSASQSDSDNSSNNSFNSSSERHCESSSRNIYQKFPRKFFQMFFRNFFQKFLQISSRCSSCNHLEIISEDLP